jgi:hypothetical protein
MENIPYVRDEVGICPGFHNVLRAKQIGNDVICMIRAPDGTGNKLRDGEWSLEKQKKDDYDGGAWQDLVDSMIPGYEDYEDVYFMEWQRVREYFETLYITICIGGKLSHQPQPGLNGIYKFTVKESNKWYVGAHQKDKTMYGRHGDVRMFLFKVYNEDGIESGEGLEFLKHKMQIKTRDTYIEGSEPGTYILFVY